jgi:hypothetical protein
MSKDYYFHILLIILLFFLDQSFFNIYSSYNIYLLLLSSLVIVLLDYDEKAFWWFLTAGLLLDLSSSLDVFGLNTVIFIGFYLIISYLKRSIVHRPNIFLIMALVVGLVLLYDLVLWLTSFGINDFIVFLSYLGGDLMVNLIAIWPIYLFFIYLSRFLKRFQLF